MDVNVMQLERVLCSTPLRLRNPPASLDGNIGNPATVNCGEPTPARLRGGLLNF